MHPSQVTGPNGPVAFRPDFQGRHSGKGGVLWLDGHATLETPVYASAAATIPIMGASGNATYTAAQMQNANIGFLCRNATELNSGQPVMDYYYLPKKETAAAPDFTAYANPANIQ
jgi:prepilin-type processing-associated H-X9-DG protein